MKTFKAFVEDHKKLDESMALAGWAGAAAIFLLTSSLGDKFRERARDIALKYEDREARAVEGALRSVAGGKYSDLTTKAFRMIVNSSLARDKDVSWNAHPIDLRYFDQVVKEFKQIESGLGIKFDVDEREHTITVADPKSLRRTIKDTIKIFNARTHNKRLGMNRSSEYYKDKAGSRKRNMRNKTFF